MVISNSFNPFLFYHTSLFVIETLDSIVNIVCLDIYSHPNFIIMLFEHLYIYVHVYIYTCTLNFNGIGFVTVDKEWIMAQTWQVLKRKNYGIWKGMLESRKYICVSYTIILKWKAPFFLFTLVVFSWCIKIVPDSPIRVSISEISPYFSYT